MISIQYLENNNILVRFDGDKKYFDFYINIIINKLFNFALPNPDGGWLFKYSHLPILQRYFKKIKYLNEYIEPDYIHMGSDMKLQPYDYQKEAIYFAINNLNSLMVLPCGSGKI